MSPWVSHRDPRWFDDPLRFRPERWENDFAKTLPRFAYLPFGGGPRVCIGNNFALMEAILVLATVLQRYRLRLPPGQTIEPFASITLRPKQGMPMVVSRREG
jgi:cytochrome P450